MPPRPEPAEHAVGTDALRRRSFVRDPRESVEEAARDGHGRRLEKAAGFGVGREELADALGEIAVGERGEAALSFGRRELDELLEERPDLGPAPDSVHGSSTTRLTSPSPSKAPGREMRAPPASGA